MENPVDMDLYRLRVEVPDGPGRVGRVLVALGDLAVNVVEIDGHNVDGEVRVDDLFVHATRPVDVPAIAVAVEKAGCSVTEIRPLSVHELEDPVTRGMRFLNQLATAPTLTDDLVAWGARELVRADLACVIDSDVAAADSVAGRALAQRVAVHDRDWVKRLPPSGRRPWLLAVPFEHAGRRVAVVVLRSGSGFTRTEAARLRALLDGASRRPDPTAPGSGVANPEPTRNVR